MDDAYGNFGGSMKTNLPIRSPLSPYLNIDPIGIFPNWGCVMSGALWGGASGLYTGLTTPELAKEAWKSKKVQMLNYVVKHSQSSATSFGAVAVIYSAIGVLLSYTRKADDELNTIVAGTATGLLYKCSAGIRVCLLSGLAGLGLTSAYAFIQVVIDLSKFFLSNDFTFEQLKLFIYYFSYFFSERIFSVPVQSKTIVQCQLLKSE
ncbi:Mitochondrial import inner membrane translocase subunit [Trichinella spiralis]|uniref:Mitochondrial import inner membrane translocase subunit n=1 Tax=Trichinella spiralis TaxID=6334 RepID=A0ABR3KEX6_TRISP